VRLIAGLSNPGARYHSTRHNVGFMVIEELSHDSQRPASFTPSCQGQLARWEIAGQEVLLLRPQTFMNRSGQSVAQVLRTFGIPSEDLVVIHDDVDLPFGSVRVKQGGGSGGHKGLNSCFEELGSRDFTRIRIGIGRPPPEADTIDYVLNEFDEEQREMLPEVIRLAAEAARETIRAGASAAMNRFNRRSTDGGEQ